MLLAEVRNDMLLFLTRNDVEAAQLVCRMFNATIASASFETAGPLRSMDLTVLDPNAAAVRYASAFYR